MAFVLTHPEMGVYLGSWVGMGFWSKLDPVGQASAITFPTEEAAESHMASWDGGRPEGAACVPIEPDLGEYASVACCAKAGLDEWDPQGPGAAA